MQITKHVLLSPDSPVIFPGGRDYTVTKLDSTVVFYEHADAVQLLDPTLVIGADVKGDHSFFAAQPARLLIDLNDDA